MRTILLGMLTALACSGLWAVGCRQESRRSSGLAARGAQRMKRAPGDAVDDSRALHPDFPVPLDPETPSLSDQTTFARIRAVLDREEAAAVDNDIGLFVLPKDESLRMAGAPASGGDVIGSYPTSRRIPGGRRARGDLTAMAPPAVRNDGAPEFALHPASIPGMYFGPDEPARSSEPVSPLSLPDALTADAFDNTAFASVYGDMPNPDIMPELSPPPAGAEAELMKMRTTPEQAPAANSLGIESAGSSEASAPVSGYAAMPGSPESPPSPEPSTLEQMALQPLESIAPAMELP